MKNDVISLTLRVNKEIQHKIEYLKQTTGEKTANKMILMLIEQHEEFLKRYNTLLDKEKDLLQRENLLTIKERKLQALARNILDN